MPRILAIPGPRGNAAVIATARNNSKTGVKEYGVAVRWFWNVMFYLEWVFGASLVSTLLIFLLPTLVCALMGLVLWCVLKLLFQRLHAWFYG